MCVCIYIYINVTPKNSPIYIYTQVVFLGVTSVLNEGSRSKRGFEKRPKGCQPWRRQKWPFCYQKNETVLVRLKSSAY